MKLNDVNCVEVNLKLQGFEIEDYAKREIGPDMEEEWTGQEIETFIYEYIKDLIKGDFGAFEMDTRLVYKKPPLGLVIINEGPHPVYPDRPYPNNLHSIKTYLGLSNTKLGELCGLGYTTIANMERGDRPITEEYKNIIEQKTGCKVFRYYES